MLSPQSKPAHQSPAIYTSLLSSKRLSPSARYLRSGGGGAARSWGAPRSSGGVCPFSPPFPRVAGGFPRPWGALPQRAAFHLKGRAERPPSLPTPPDGRCPRGAGPGALPAGLPRQTGGETPANTDNPSRACGAELPNAGKILTETRETPTKHNSASSVVLKVVIFKVRQPSPPRAEGGEEGKKKKKSKTENREENKDRHWLKSYINKHFSD